LGSIQKHNRRGAKPLHERKKKYLSICLSTRLLYASKS
jgi:hypothetical protein